MGVPSFKVYVPREFIRDLLASFFILAHLCALGGKAVAHLFTGIEEEKTHWGELQRDASG